MKKKALHYSLPYVGLLFLCLFVFMPFGFVNVYLKIDDVKSFHSLGLYQLIFGGGEITSSLETIKVEFNPLYFLAFIILILGFVFYVINDILKRKKKNTFGLGLTSLLFYFISFISFALIFYFYPLTSNVSSLVGFREVEVIGYTYEIFLFIIFILMLLALKEVVNYKKINIKEIAEIAILIALAVVLDKVTFFKMPTGGSVNISALPLMIIALRHGPFKGLFASSVVFGLVSSLLDGYGLQFYPFDYFIGFAGYAFIGVSYYLVRRIFKKSNETHPRLMLGVGIVSGSIVAFIIRMIGSSLSSMIFYDYTLEAALIYNLSYIPLSVFISMAILLVLIPIYIIIDHRFKIKDSFYAIKENKISLINIILLTLTITILVASIIISLLIINNIIVF